MNTVSLALELRKIAGHFVYIVCEPEIFDFTSDQFQGSLLICHKNDCFRIVLNKENLISFLGILKAAIFDDKNFTVLCWNIKTLFSFIKFYTKAQIEYECRFIDIKLLEAFLGIKNKAPVDFLEAAGRAKIISSDDSYSKAKEIYLKIHVPLFSEVIPSIETIGLYNKTTRTALYSCYEIEGQINGRMNCHGAYKHSFTPHTIGPEERKILCPRGIDEVFVYFDYHNMEVSMLQWLSKDEHLEQILNLDEDFYKVLFKLISGSVCDTEKKRETSKNIFLPVIYGMQANEMASQVGISINTAEKIIDRIYKLFPQALKWIQEEFNVVCYDYFGRKRFFNEKFYKSRNYKVQAPASIVCSEKLIKLYNNIKSYGKIVCYIHDGYVINCNKAYLKTVVAIGKEALESDSELCAGIKLKSSVKVGDNLNELKEV